MHFLLVLRKMKKLLVFNCVCNINKVVPSTVDIFQSGPIHVYDIRAGNLTGCAVRAYAQSLRVV